MWPQVKHSCHFVARKLAAVLHPLTEPRVEAVRVGYHKAGLTVWDEPVSWNAEALAIEALVRLPPRGEYKPEAFSASCFGQATATAQSMTPHEEDAHCLSFRLAPPRRASPVDVCWEGRPLAQASVALLAEGDFLQGLRLQSPAILAQVGPQHVPCRAVVAGQCRGLLACGLVEGETSLAPLCDLGLAVELHDHLTGRAERVPVPLLGRQLGDRRALCAVSLPELPERPGFWSVAWTAAGRELARSRLRVLTPEGFRQSLHVAESGYVYRRADGLLLTGSRLPPRQEVCGLGPWFRVASREPGAVGLCVLGVLARQQGEDQPACLLQEEVLVTDVPASVHGPLLTAEEFGRVTGFECLCRRRPLGEVPGCPRPVVRFTAEGGFSLPDDLDWVSAGETEDDLLRQKLSELGEAEDGGQKLGWEPAAPPLFRRAE